MLAVSCASQPKMGRVQHGYCTACQLVLPGRWENSESGVGCRVGVLSPQGISDLRCSSKRATFGVVCDASGSPSDRVASCSTKSNKFKSKKLADRTYLEYVEYQHSPSTTAVFFVPKDVLLMQMGTNLQACSRMSHFD